MNTRQQYKMAALQGILTTSRSVLFSASYEDAQMLAKTAGKMADAMIEEDRRVEKGIEPFPEIKDEQRR